MNPVKLALGFVPVVLYGLLVTWAGEDAVPAAALAALVLAAVIFATLPVLPFTEQFAREMVPASVAATPRFSALNRRLSAAWGVAVLGLAAGHALAAALDDDLNRLGELLLDWGVPGVLLYGAYRYTTRLAGAAAPRSAHAS